MPYTLRCALIGDNEIQMYNWCDCMARYIDPKFLETYDKMTFDTNHGLVNVDFTTTNNVNKIHDIDCAILMFDCKYPFSLCKVATYFEELRAKLPAIPIVICGLNKEFIEMPIFGQIIKLATVELYDTKICNVSVEQELNIFEPIDILFKHFYGINTEIYSDIAFIV